MRTRIIFALGISLTLAAHSRVAHAQGAARYEIDPSSSLAWWQIDPNYGHLWATTCPADPSWQAGEGRSPGERVDMATRKQTSSAGRSDSRIPLYPRGAVTPVCRRAVRGQLTVADAGSWEGVRGEVVVLPDSLHTGLKMRDTFARKGVFETRKYPHLRFTIDSLTAVQPGDTIRAVAHGVYEMHGAKRPISAQVRAWPESNGLRALAQFQLDADALTKQYGMPAVALGMGVTLGRWDAVHIGVDLLLREVR